MTTIASFGAQAGAVLSALQNEGIDLSTVAGAPGQLWALMVDAAANGISAETLLKIADMEAISSYGLELTCKHAETGALDAAGFGYMALYLFCSSPGRNLNMAAMALGLHQAQKEGVAPSAAAIALVHEQLLAQAQVVA